MGLPFVAATFQQDNAQSYVAGIVRNIADTEKVQPLP